MNEDLNNENRDLFDNTEQNNYYSDDNYNEISSYKDEEKKSGIWWKILLVLIVIVIIIILLLKFCGDNNEKSKDDQYAELTSKICIAAETYANSNANILGKREPGRSSIIKFQTLSDSNLIEAQIENPYYDGGLFNKGTQPRYYSMDNSVRLMVMNDGKINCELVNNASDVTVPELRLNGDAEISLALGTEFEDPGYTATDDYDGDITSKVVISGNVDSTKVGTYELTYTVQDSAGNVTTKTRKIIYEEYADIDITLGSVYDSVTPQISLKGSNPYCMVKGTKYVEPGAVATDNVDGNITDRIAVTNKVTGNLMGSFRVVYKVEDSSGNQAIAYRAVIVTTSCPEEQKPENVVNNRPTISLIGKSAVTINKGTEYIDLGATAYDKEDGDITGKIITDATGVNVNSAGIYKVIYRVTDSGGLTATVTRTVTVKETVVGNPVVRFTESKKNVEVFVGEGDNSLISAPKAVNENGVQVSVTTKIEDYTTKKSVTSIDWSKEGKYRVIYTAVHGNGVLKQTKSITVTITNGTVTIGGKDAINVNLRSENCDITEADLVKGGVTFVTKGSSTPIVEINNNKDIACAIGSYEVEVSARVNDGPVSAYKIKVSIINGGEEVVNQNVPGKPVITYNSANPSNVYNTNGVWVGGAVSGIELRFQAALPTNSEISYFEWSSDCSTAESKLSKTGSNTSAMAWTKEGKNKVCVRAVSITGIEGPWSNPVNLYIDKTGPKIEFTHTWADGKDDWHNSSTLTLSYKANDSESGLSHFEYTYDDVKAKKAEDVVTYEEATGNLIVSENTEPTRPELFVYVRAVDKAGNKGEWTVNPAYANMDTIKPNAPTITVSGNNTATVKITATATDNVNSVTNRNSGIGKFEYDLVDTLNNLKDYYANATIDKDNKLKATATFTVPTNGTDTDQVFNVRVWAVDKAGNKSEQSADENITVKPGKTVESVKLKNGDKEINEGDACQTSTLYVGKSITLTATPVPIDALEKEVIWKVKDATIAVIDEDGKITAKKAGTTEVTAKIGEVSKTCVLTVKSEASPATPGTGGNAPGSGGGQITCNVANCKTCSSNDTCSVCNSGYSLVGSKCLSCYDGCIANGGNVRTCQDFCGSSNTSTTPGTTCNVANCKTCSSNGTCSACNDGYTLSGGQCTKTTGVCCAYGGSQGVVYSWSSTGSCGGGSVASGKTQATCTGSSRDEQVAYCHSQGKYYTCPTGYVVTDTDSYGCKKCKKEYTKTTSYCVKWEYARTCTCSNGKSRSCNPTTRKCYCNGVYVSCSKTSCKEWHKYSTETVSDCKPFETVDVQVLCT